ncbi:MAG: DUF2285 domain-containing protein [Alphaproteobacteria bacterium]|nr:DUF2285 domain-containing protein [Alphaproteobacteria bacterium]
MAKPKLDCAPILDDVPWSDDLTDYDRAHFITYVRLLDASDDDASDDDMCRIVLGIDPVKEPSRAKRALESHLRRARWMTERGFRQLLQ